MKNEAVRDKLADWYVSSQGLKYSALPHHDGALARRDAGAGIARSASWSTAPKLQDIAAFAMDLMEQGGIITDPELAPLRRRVPADR